MLSTPKSKTHIPQRILDLFDVPELGPDPDNENNIVEVRCLDAAGRVLAYGSFVTPTRSFKGSMVAQESGYCTMIATRIYWAETKDWIPCNHRTNDPHCAFIMDNLLLSRGDTATVTGRITGP